MKICDYLVCDNVICDEMNDGIQSLIREDGYIIHIYKGKEQQRNSGNVK